MRIDRISCWIAFMLAVVPVIAAAPRASAQTPAPAVAPAQPELTPAISLAEARSIIGGAIAFARANDFRLAVAVVDPSGAVVSLDTMDGVRANDTLGAEGKAFAAAVFRQTTQELSELYKSRPDRFFGILNMYPGKVYLVGGGVPLVRDGKLVGGVGVAGLHQFVDEKAARAGIAAWEAFRANSTK
jgi:glc operon protein GlcG